MKNLFALLTFLFVASIADAQDTIRKTDGAIIVCIVKEINEDNIVYTRFDQPEGPIRKISITNVAEITFVDGVKEQFTVSNKPEVKESKPEVGPPGTINNTGRTVVIHRTGPDIKIRPGEVFPGADVVTDKILNFGSYLEGMVGYAESSKMKPGNYYNNYDTTYYTQQNLTFGMRFGTKFYFGNDPNERFGLNIAWVNFTGMLNEENRFDVIFAPVNLGPAIAFKFDEHTGMEVNTAFGLGVSSIYRSVVGMKYGVDVKYRYDALAIGLDLSRTTTVFGAQKEYANLIALTAGFKF